jgi:hypothetical protein
VREMDNVMDAAGHRRGKRGLSGFPNETLRYAQGDKSGSG